MKMYFEYRTINDMNLSILKNLNRFSYKIDLVVGIPRSGMIPANLLALYLNKPYTDIDSFIDGRIYGCGRRERFIDKEVNRNILVIDDSVGSGESMTEAKNKLSSLSNDYNIKYGAVYVTSNSKSIVDVYCEVIDWPRIFQWNFFHSYHIKNSCFDIDGVLCVDPPIDDDGELYKQYISNAIPLYEPSVPIDTIVSSRLEKYRKETEEWLKNNKIRYKSLVLLNVPNKKERDNISNIGEFKARVYKKSKTTLFVESSYKQAVEIARITGKPVFCTENFSIVMGGGVLLWKGQLCFPFVYYNWQEHISGQEYIFLRREYK